jgi:SpoU rRNA methylase family enzyme
MTCFKIIELEELEWEIDASGEFVKPKPIGNIAAVSIFNMLLIFF